MEGAMARFARIGTLPLPLKQHVQLAAASAASSGLFGAGQHHIPDFELKQVRQAGLRAIWRTSFRACPEMVFCGLGLPARVDPLAQAVLRPWYFIMGTIDRGTWQAGKLAMLVSQGFGEVVGPVAAAWASLRRAKITPDNQHSVWTDAAGRTIQKPFYKPRKTVM